MRLAVIFAADDMLIKWGRKGGSDRPCPVFIDNISDSSVVKLFSDMRASASADHQLQSDNSWHCIRPRAAAARSPVAARTPKSYAAKGNQRDTS